MNILNTLSYWTLLLIVYAGLRFCFEYIFQEKMMRRIDLYIVLFVILPLCAYWILWIFWNFFPF